MIQGEYLKDVGKTLQWFRKERRFTQANLAEVCGVEYRHYQDIEGGKINLKLETLVRILKAFDTDLMTFFYLVHEKVWKFHPPARSGEEYFGNWCLLKKYALRHPRMSVSGLYRDLFLANGDKIKKGDREALARLPGIAMHLNEGRHCLWANDETYNFYGNGILGSNGEKFFCRPEDIKLQNDLTHQVITGELNSYYLELPFKNKDNQIRIVGKLGIPQLDASGANRNLVMLQLDLTDEKVAENELLKFVGAPTPSSNSVGF